MENRGSRSTIGPVSDSSDCTRSSRCRPGGVALLVGVLFALVPGCNGLDIGTGGVRVWAAPEDVNVFPGSRPEAENIVFSHAESTIRLDAGINEAAAFQLVLAADASPAMVRSVTLGDLAAGAHAIPGDAIRIYRQEWITVRDYPSWYLRLAPETRRERRFPDPLVPLTAEHPGLPITVPAGECVPLWVEVRVPPGTTPGVYRAPLRIGTRLGTARELTVILRVWPFAVPQTRHLPVLTGVRQQEVLRHHMEVDGRPYAPVRLTLDDPFYDRATAILDATAKLLHEHRCTPVWRDIRPTARLGPGGRIELDWTDYDRLVGPVIEGRLFADRIAASAWPLPVDMSFPSQAAHGHWTTRSYQDALTRYIELSVDHFRRRGWHEKSFVWLSPPGRDRGERYQRYEELLHRIRAIAADLPMACSLLPYSMEPFGWVQDGFRDLSGGPVIWYPPVGLVDPAEVGRPEAQPGATWLRPDVPPFSGSLDVIGSAVHARSLPWQAYRFGCEAIIIPETTLWTTDAAGPARTGHEPTLFPGFADGEEDAAAPLLWPGKPYGLEHPIPSLRLKRLLRGVQDYEYLWLLERNRRPGVARLIAADLFPAGGALSYGEHFLDGRPHAWVSDPAAWALARRLMARELTAAIEAGRPAAEQGEEQAVQDFERQIEWSRLIEAVRRVDLHIEGVRVQVNHEEPAHPVELEAIVSVFNATRRPLSAGLRFTDVPVDWVLPESAVMIENLGASRSTFRALRAKAPPLEASLAGTVAAGVMLDGGDGRTATATARISVLTSARLERPITIDGRLDEWPFGQRNVAGDFVLVGGAHVPKHGRPHPDRPMLDTAAYVCHDDDHLYIAFRCEDHLLRDRLIRRDNVVRYDGLWPTGEDLVEVVIDPTGQATGPGDLYHIIVKANGAVVTQQGVPCLDRVGSHRPWPAAVVAAVNDTAYPDRWTVEIRIPRDALPEPAPVWGINFARYHARLGEYASWSAASRHVYTPAALGNMRVGP